MPLVTAHFSESELACHDGTPYPFDLVDEFDPERRIWRVTRATPLCETAEAIRTRAGGAPMTVISAYRNVAYQGALKAKYPDDPAVASANGSQHVQGRALDLRHAVLSAKAFHDLILDAQRAGDLPLLGGLGEYPDYVDARGVAHRGFVHVDVRPKPPSNHLARWRDSRPDSRV